MIDTFKITGVVFVLCASTATAQSGSLCASTTQYGDVCTTLNPNGAVRRYTNGTNRYEFGDSDLPICGKGKTPNPNYLCRPEYVDPYDIDFKWQTGRDAILCNSYFKINDAEATARVQDTSWLKQTGCLQAPAGLRVVLIDVLYNSESGDIWRGHVYPLQGDGMDMYFRESSVVGFAASGIFKSITEAEKAFSAMQQKSTIYTVGGHRMVELGNGSEVYLMIGPATFTTLEAFCMASGGVGGRIRGCRSPDLH